MARLLGWKAASVMLLTTGTLCAGGLVAQTAPDSLTPRAPPVMLRLNVPAYRVDVLESGLLTASYAVAVGERRYKTPLGSFQITHITWNPWWNPPTSDWARGEPITPPGEKNPMGPAKLHFGTLYFLHGTPFESSIGKAASHGCVRMRDADVRTLARTLNRLAGGGVPEDTLDVIESNTTRTLKVALRAPVPLEIAYVTVELVDARLYLHRDVYGLGRPTEDAALAVLAAAGYGVDQVRRDVLARLVRGARTRSASVAIDSLIPAEAIAAARGGATPALASEPARPARGGEAWGTSPDQSRSEAPPAATSSCSSAS